MGTGKKSVQDQDVAVSVNANLTRLSSREKPSIGYSYEGTHTGWISGQQHSHVAAGAAARRLQISVLVNPVSIRGQNRLHA